ncbi:MAG: hypothetical protein EA380_10420 [Phycisphaeraceae bacterium]|nr:MAG: hypothetical protein EA380_10420 [Phycisphaeraceae bacterium]
MKNSDSRGFAGLATLLVAIGILAGVVQAQHVLHPIHPAVDRAAAVDTIVMDPIDSDALLAEELPLRRTGRPNIIAVANTDQAYSPANSGSIENIGDGWIAWRLRIDAPGSKSINLGTLFDVPDSTALYLLGPDGNTPYRAITSEDGTRGEFWTPMIEAPVMEIYAEMLANEFAAFEAGFVITSINLGFEDLRLTNAFADDREEGERGISAACNVDVLCPQGDPWQDQIRSVGRTLRSGTALCSGAMINNTAQDRTPYFITADHCGATASNANQIVIYWNYQNSFCRTPGSAQSGQNGNGSLSQFSSGTTLRMRRGPSSDITLLEINNPPPSGYNIHWAGWDRNNNNSSSGVGIHHPAGAEKRISTYSSSTSQSTVFIIGIGNVASYIVQWSSGITEGGSSGSPLFNSGKRIIGILSGGSSSCANPNGTDAYARFATAWTGTSSGNRLVDWLDPLGTGQTTLDGVDETPPPAPGPFSLIFPAEGADDIDADAFNTFTWGTSADATSYTVTISPNPNLSFPVVGPTDRASPNITIFPGTLSENTTYYWGVVAKNAGPTTTPSTPAVGSFSTIDPTPPPSCSGDINGDGNTGLDDFIILAGNFGAGPGATLAQGDLNGDGFVDLDDFIILAGDFGCTSP